MTDPTRLQRISAARRSELITGFQACVERELERLHRPPDRSKLGVAVAARYRRALRELGNQIVNAMRDELTVELRSKVGAVAKTARAKPDAVGDGATFDVLRDAVDAIESAALEAIACIEASERAAATTDNENRWSQVGILAFVLAVCLGVLLGMNSLPLTGYPLLVPVLRGSVMIIQVTAVLAIAALIIAFMRAMRIAPAERLVDALYTSAKDAVKAAPTGPGPALLTTLISTKGLAVAAVATGVAATAIEHQRQNPPLDAGAIRHEIASGVAKAVSETLEKLDTTSINSAAKNLDDAAKRLSATAEKLDSCNTPECKSPAPAAHKIELTLDKTLASSLALKLALDKESIDALNEIKKIHPEPGPGWTLLSQSITRLDSRVDALVKNNHDNRLDFMKAYSYTSDRLWRLCFETHLFADATATQRKGLVNFGAGEPPARISLDCHNVFALPPPPLPPATSE